jgi:hypothetical protein
MQQQQHQLIFTMSLAVSQELIKGSLVLKYPSGEEINYLATSGLPDWQRPEDQWARGKGPIPAREGYRIPTTPYPLDTRGIEGYFFHITPDPVIGSGDRIRSELGIHYDANVPGTSGCIGLINRDGWNGFCRRMTKIAELGVKSLSLKVKY